jgi:hypothetical protein
MGLPRTMLLGSVDVVQLQQWSEQHCFGFSDYCPHTCTVSATALAFQSFGNGVRLDIPGTMSESVGVLKLQAVANSSRGGGRSDSQTPTAVPSAFGGARSQALEVPLV